MTIQAKETRYKGYRFRSRLEARWAVFFDALGIQWEYEKEGYDVPGTSGYLPDFYLSFPRSELKFWAEVKGVEPTKEESGKLAWVANRTKTFPLMLVGLPGTIVHMYNPWANRWELMWPDFWDTTVTMLASGANIANALRAARSARFEHGETPQF